jgi:YHS domain-containing protein
MQSLYEIFLYLLLFFALRGIFRQFMGGFRSSRGGSSSRSRPPSPIVAGELKKDPVCGAYVSTAGSLTQTVDGSPVYFCSKECRDKYLAR